MSYFSKVVIFMFIVTLLFVGFVLHGIDAQLYEWRSDYERNNYVYVVQVTGLEGKVVNGTANIIVPIPANSDGLFVSTPTQKEPGISRKFLYEYVFNTPIDLQKGPYLENTTETFDNRSIDGNWSSYIVATEDGFMLSFQTNETLLENIYLKKLVVLDYVDGLNPLEKNNPILYPAANFSYIGNISSGGIESSFYEPTYTYDTYIYTSDNLNGTQLHFSISLGVKEQVSKGSNLYSIGLQTNTNTSGKTKVAAIVSQKKERYSP
ncbi:hypothetical protein [Methanolobus sp. WCC5]|uniref:hypothetical protein n=1 Tax=Methanolobus sp. WCC5 TaxID=3125785 RepID=UPI00324BCD7B